MSFKRSAFESKPLMCCSKIEELLNMPLDDAFTYMSSNSTKVIFFGGAKRKP